MQLSDTLAGLADGIETIRADVEAVAQQRYCRDCGAPNHTCEEEEER